MRAAFKKSPLEVIIRDIEQPTVGDYDVLVKVMSCGICGGDLSQSDDYRPFGHEIAGIVVSKGRFVDHIAPGDHVAIESGSFCGVCSNCRDGRVDLCSNPSIGSFSGFAEYVVVPAQNVMKFEGITFKQAAITEPLGVAIDLVYTADIKLNDHVLIVGAGSIGLMALSLARSMGATRIYVAQNARSAKKIELARRLGADDVIYTDELNLEDYAFPRGGVDKVLVTAPPRTIPKTFKVANYGGTIAYIGFSPEATISFDANLFHVRKLQLRASFAKPGLYFPTAIDMIKTGIIDPDLLITHTFHLDGIGDMMKTLATDRASVIKCVMLNG